MPASPIEHSWRRIDSWLAANAPRTFASLRPPADRAAIDAAAAELGVELPADLVAYLRHHDGVAAGEGAFGFPGFEPHGLAEIVRATRMTREISARYDDDLFEGFWHHDFVSIARNVSADGTVVVARWASRWKARPRGSGRGGVSRRCWSRSPTACRAGPP